MDDPLSADLRDGVLELVLNRVDARNAINHPLHDAIDAALDEAELDADVRAVLIRAAGPVFSAGHDLKEMYDPNYHGPLFPNEGFPVQTPSRGRLVERAWYFRKPLICAVHGYVGPGATALVCCADFNIAADGTRFGFEIFRKGGHAPGYYWLPLYVQLPLRVIEKLFLMGGWLDAREALQFQLVQRVVPNAELIGEARRWAEQAARIPSERFGHAKDEIRRSFELLGLSSLHAAVARQTPPRTGPRIETLADTAGMAAALSFRDEGIDDDVSRV